MIADTSSRLGRVFRKELPPQHAERREADRFPVNADASCPFLSAAAEVSGPVRIKDVSMTGVGLLVRERIEPGALLAMTLVNAARGFTKTVIVRVVQVAALSGGYLVGGTFTVPLSYQEMTTLVM